MSVTNNKNPCKVNESYLNLCLETKVVETVQQSYTFQVLSKHFKAKSVTFFSFMITKFCICYAMKAQKNTNSKSTIFILVFKGLGIHNLALWLLGNSHQEVHI